MSMHHRTITGKKIRWMCITSVPFLAASLQDSSTTEREIFQKKCIKCPDFLQATPIWFYSGWTQEIEPVVRVGKPCGRRLGLYNHWEWLGVGGQRYQAPVKHTRQTHITPHLLRWSPG